jgi:metal-responsive CopG/Arc/MetJ family transcriptional regulator
MAETVRSIRLSDDFVAKLDAWAANQNDKPGRSEAIRRLVEIGHHVAEAFKILRAGATG